MPSARCTALDLLRCSSVTSVTTVPVRPARPVRPGAVDVIRVIRRVERNARRKAVIPRECRGATTRWHSECVGLPPRKRSSSARSRCPWVRSPCIGTGATPWASNWPDEPCPLPLGSAEHESVSMLGGRVWR